MKLSRTLKTLLLLLVALTAGMGNAWAEVQVVATLDIGGVTYQLEYEIWKGSYARVTAIYGTNETVTIRDYVNYGDLTYKVKYVNGDPLGFFLSPIVCSTVKTLIFEGPISFRTSWSITGTLTAPTFDCESLTDIYFKGASPDFWGGYSCYFAAPAAENLTIHVSDLTDEEIAERKDSLSPWRDFADVVPYNAAESERVNITVTVEEAYAGTGAMFKYNSDQYIYGHGTKTYTKNKFSDYTFYVADDEKSKVKNVYVNGEDVYGNMTEVTGSESPFYSASNVKKYTIEDVASDVSIRITSEETVNHYTLCAGHGGKIEFELENQLNTIENGRYGQFAFDKSQTLTVTATPYEGYEFDSFWYEGIKYDSDLGNWITMETRDDGTFVANLALGTFQMPYTDNSHVVAFNFKEKPHKPIVRIQTTGTPRNVAQMYFRVGDKALYSVDADGLATLSRTDTLDAGSKYKLNFANARYYNLKRITVNGEEIALPTGTVNKFTEELTLSEEGDHILLEFDDIHVACSTTDGGSTSFQYYINGARNTISRGVATELTLTSIDANQPITLVMTPNEGFTLQLFFNGAEIPLADASIPESNIPGNYMVEENGTYQFQIPAAMVKLGSKMDFAVSYKKISFFDVNSDGEINVSDVTSLVNKILHP
ncbi:MAG: hypothetical protein J5698_00565 [Bacteroidaceae bacterium]|nr:hypothetical protein [Bacteroidaceae bacterium]